MLIPEVIGFKLTGKLREGATATDLVLTVTQMLRKKGVVGKFVEFFGAGLDDLPLADRATIANMAPEYGATCGFFPIDAETLRYLRVTGRDAERVALVEAYAKAQGLWRDANDARSGLHRHARARPRHGRAQSLAGPKRPQDRVPLSQAAPAVRRQAWRTEFDRKDDGKRVAVRGRRLRPRPRRRRDRRHHQLHQHLEPLASCSPPACSRATPSKRGLKVKPWVKTSLAPGSQVVTDYLDDGRPAEATSTRSASTSSATAARPASAIPARCPSRSPRRSTTATSSSAAVLSGNRNFEGRVNPHDARQLPRLAAAGRRLRARRHR